VFNERNLRALPGANGGYGLQKILVDLDLQHVDFLERYLHFGQTFEAGTSLVFRSKMAESGRSKRWLIPGFGLELSISRHFRVAPQSQWRVAAQNLDMTTAIQTPTPPKILPAAVRKHGSRTAARGGRTVWSRHYATICE